MPRKIVQLVATTVNAYTTRLFAVDDNGRAWRLTTYEDAPDTTVWLALPSLPEREG